MLSRGETYERALARTEADARRDLARPTQPEEVREALAEALRLHPGVADRYDTADALLPVLAGLEQRWREDEREQALRDVLDALRLIDRDGCEHFTRGRCLDPSSSKTRGARDGADAWCPACIAADALRRAAAGPAPQTGEGA